LLSPLLCVGVSVMFVAALCDFTLLRLKHRFLTRRTIDGRHKGDWKWIIAWTQCRINSSPHSQREPKK
jgi:hypothetical protein